MLSLRVVQARYGDCLIVEHGTGKRRKHILIDGGPPNVYKPYLKPELQAIAAAGGQIDLMVLTHIDNDHAVGLIDFMKDLKAQREQGQAQLIQVKRIWHNAFQKILPEAGQEAADLEAIVLNQPVDAPPLEGALPNPPADEEEFDPGAVEFGVKEGVQLELADHFFSIPRNFGFSNGLVELETARRPERLAALRMWVLGPSRANLDDLRATWLRWLDDQAGRVSFDVTTPVVKPDDSVNNLSSIMLLFEGYGRSLLLAGDGRSKDIIAGLEGVGKLPPGGTCRVDVLKVPHHASARNAVGELFDRVLADTYVISADGRYGNPDWQTLVWLMEAARRQEREIRIVATNWTAGLRRLTEEYPSESSRYTLDVLAEGQRSLVV